MTEQRRLAAIVSADVAGYSRLMGRDESGTLAALKAIRRKIVDPKIAEHRGRIVKTTGDGLLLEFASAVDAVRCVVEVQMAMTMHNADVPQEMRIQFRIGVNIGDVIIEDNDIFGDGVNVAARLEKLAQPGEILVTRAIFEQVQDKLALEHEGLGERLVKNIARPIDVHRIKSAVDYVAARETEPSRSASRSPLQQSEQSPPSLSVAVLPLANLTGTSADDHFVDGITEDLIADLSRISGAFVIARNTSFTYKGKSVNVRQLGRELGVRYVLEGGVRRGDGRVRVSAQLIDADTGSHVWADRFDSAAEEAYALQDEVTGRLARALNIELKDAVSRRAARGRPDDLEAADLATRGWAILFNRPQSQETNEEARQVLEQALRRDPQNAEAWTGFSYLQSRAATYGWSQSSEEAFRLALDAGERAAALDPRSADAHLVLGYAVWGAHADHSRARHLFTRCLELNPNYAPGYFWLGVLDIVDGHAHSTLTLLQRAFRLSPRDGLAAIWQYFVAVAKIVLDDDAAAIQAARAGIAINPKFPNNYGALAAALAHQGHKIEAVAALDRYYEVSPNRTIEQMLWATQRCHVDRPAFARYVAGLREAGMPEC